MIGKCLKDIPEDKIFVGMRVAFGNRNLYAKGTIIAKKTGPGYIHINLATEEIEIGESIFQVVVDLDKGPFDGMTTENLFYLEE